MRTGRPAGPVDPGAPPSLRSLALFLRSLKDASGADYAELSRRTGEPGQPGYRGASTLSQAASGRRLPLQITVEAFVLAASHPAQPDQDIVQQRLAHARRLHRAAAATRTRPTGRGPRLHQIRTPTALGQGLTRLHQRAGSPSLTTLESATHEAGHRIPRSRIRLILNGQTLPSHDQLTALLTALATDPDTAGRWHGVLERIEDRRRPPIPYSPHTYSCADGDPAVQARLDKRYRDEQIKRRTGHIRPDETYEDYEERLYDQQLRDQELEEQYQAWLNDQANNN